ncbi:MAG: cytochrome c [Solirubrobacterales bacterium]|nr:cytochrome c [Solirubrobacterales bacterium]MBV9472397.1 cytochrome c [Solirubrobacterales bacterium]MBV9836751.1 cytochrome c [Solirubrobacterales bacterium]
MSRPVRVLLLASAMIAVAAVAVACGTQRIAVPKASSLYAGAVLFNQRCSGCHTLSYAATQGSAPNVRTAQANNGPDFDIRCERPVTRVLYAIENGGFSGAYMPQNVVVGQDAIEVAKFVATYSGRKAPKVTGTTVCSSQPIGTIPPPTATATANTTPTTTTAPSSTAHKGAAKGAKAKKRPARP